MEISLSISSALYPKLTELIVYVPDGDEACSYKGAVATEEEGAYLQREITGTLNKEKIAGCLLPLRGLSLTPIPPFTMGLDGHTTTLTISQGYSSVAFSWWTDLPEAWNVLRPLCVLLIETMGLDACEVLGPPAD